MACPAGQEELDTILQIQRLLKMARFGFITDLIDHILVNITLQRGAGCVNHPKALHS
jgi:hypothetical protein